MHRPSRQRTSRPPQAPGVHGTVGPPTWATLPRPPQSHRDEVPLGQGPGPRAVAIPDGIPLANLIELTTWITHPDQTMQQNPFRERFPAPFPRHATRLIGLVVATGTIVLTMAAGPSIAGAQTSPDQAGEIVRHVDDLLRGESSHGTVRMEVVTERWTRTMEMEMWSLGQEYSLVRVLSPSREAGTATLKVDRDIWNYLPRVDRTIKVPGSGMGGSWMGSHFTYDDLVRESSMVDDYEIEVSFEGERDGTELWEFTLTPLPEAPVVWGRLELEVRKNDRMPQESRYFDDRGELARTMTFSNFRTMDGRLVPTELSMRPEDKPGERTTLQYEDLEFNTGLSSSFFSLQRLRGGP
jgi:hypothetical protein